MKFKTLKEKLMSDQTFATEYKKVDLAFEIGQIVLEARIIKGLTQRQLAKLVETKQPSIARLEKGNFLPSLRFLQKIARALKTYLLPPRFGFMVEVEEIKNNSNALQVERIYEIKPKLNWANNYSAKLKSDPYSNRQFAY